jgi:glyoxylase-like metal-dependent hydrolase (beta-lactamase superfamily II)
LIACVESEQRSTEWILETHVHADHISAAPYIKSHLGGKTGIGKHIIAVQKIFSAFFAVEADFHADGSQFDHLFDDDEMFEVGTIRGVALHTP